MSINWGNSVWVGRALLAGTVISVVIDFVTLRDESGRVAVILSVGWCTRLVLRKIERQTEQAFELGALVERHHAELKGQDPTGETRVTPLIRRRSVGDQR